MKELLLGTALLVGGVVVISAVSLGIYAVTKPASIAIDTAAFHNSQAFNDGMAKDLGNFQMEYVRTDDMVRRAVLRAVILDRFAGYDDARLPPHLRNFLNHLKTGG